jgi:hypothetical protein
MVLPWDFFSSLQRGYTLCQRSLLPTTARNRTEAMSLSSRRRERFWVERHFFTVHKIAPPHYSTGHPSPPSNPPIAMIARSAAFRAVKPSANCSRSAWTWARQGCNRQHDAGASSRPSSTQTHTSPTSSLASSSSSPLTGNNNLQFAGRFFEAIAPAQESCPSIYRAAGLQDKNRPLFQPSAL